MTIRARLSWIFALSSLVVVLTMGSLIYFQLARFHSREFSKRLEERVALTELIFLEKNEVIEEAVRARFLQTLDGEKEYVIPTSPQSLDSLTAWYGPDLAQKIYTSKSLQFEEGRRMGFSKHYVLPEGEFIVIVTAVDTFGKSSLLYLRKILIACAILSLLIIGLASYLGTSRALRPLKAQIRQVSKIGQGRIELRLDVNEPVDELGQLAKAFNSMLDSLQSTLQAQRQFVRNASHEMRNPLTAIRGEAELVLHKPRSPEEYRTSLSIVSAEARRLQTLISQLLDLEKAESLSALPNPGMFAPDQCLLEALDTFPSGRLHLDFETIGEDHAIPGNADLMRTALANIIDNALKYSGDKMVRVSFSRQGDFFKFSVKDQGIGIPPSDLSKIFQPFFRSANARPLTGHGIGLPLAHRIIHLHGGTLSFTSTIQEGTEATILLPSS